MALRTIIRKGQPVQVSLRRLHKGKASKAENKQASKIAYDARLPVNDGAAALGLDAMIDLMTSRLFQLRSDGGENNRIKNEGRHKQSFFQINTPKNACCESRHIERRSRICPFTS